MWNSSFKKWEYENHTQFTFSSLSGSSHVASNKSLPSLLNHINQFKVEDCMMK